MSKQSEYTKIREVGKGGYGTAILVKDKNNQQCIMKSIDITRMTRKERQDAINEVEVLSGLDHPYVVKYRESFLENNRFLIIMEYCAGGDLGERISQQRKTRKHFPEDQIVRWLAEALMALKVIHDKHILHRDLKPQNLFLDSDGRLRIGDFGISKVLDSTHAFARTAIGTPYYISPEICESTPYAWASDIWSLGCVLFEMASLKGLFAGAKSVPDLIHQIRTAQIPTIPSYYSPELRQICASMLQRCPGKRPSAAAVIGHKIIQSAIQDLLKAESDRHVKPPAHLVSPMRPVASADRAEEKDHPMSPFKPPVAPVRRREKVKEEKNVNKVNVPAGRLENAADKKLVGEGHAIPKRGAAFMVPVNAINARSPSPSPYVNEMRPAGLPAGGFRR